MGVYLYRAVNGRFALSMRDYQSQVADVPTLVGAVEAKDRQLVVSLSPSRNKSDRPYRVLVRVRDSI